MKKIVLWAACGFGLAILCGAAGLPHLSASIVTLTVFCTVPALLISAHGWFLGFLMSLPERIAALIELPGDYSNGGKRGPEQ